MRKYNVMELVEKEANLKSMEWYLASERNEGNYDNTYDLVEYKDGKCHLATRKYDNKTGCFVVKETVAEASDVFFDTC